MNEYEVISSGLLESYVLGTASAEENEMINNLCLKHPSLTDEIELIEEALIRYSSQSITPINKELKNKLTEQLFSGPQQTAKVIPLNNDTKIIRLYKLGIAASLVFVITSMIYVFSIKSKLNELHSELTKAITSNTSLDEQLSSQQTALVVATSKLQILSDPRIKTIGLKGMNSLASTSALVHWNVETSDVYFNAAALPATPSDKQYQLWAIIDGKPVDAGVIELSADSTFQKMKSIKGAQSFAVTIEKSGGANSPTMDTMCLLGNV
ncbi:MAG: anti-sigma factor [Bacteroidetes bacterium]|nr:anti-sigma factor [Bacteroidota bacterium]